MPASRCCTGPQGTTANAFSRPKFPLRVSFFLPLPQIYLSISRPAAAARHGDFMGDTPAASALTVEAEALFKYA
jgi:hypothetical protein